MSHDKERSDAAGERLVHNARRLLREGTSELDATTLARLAHARRQALDEYDRRQACTAWPGAGWRSGLAAAALGVLAVALWVGRDGAPPASSPVFLQPPAQNGGGARSADLEMLLTEENFELLEDLDFFEWMEANLEPTEGADAGRSG